MNSFLCVLFKCTVVLLHCHKSSNKNGYKRRKEKFWLAGRQRSPRLLEKHPTEQRNSHTTKNPTSVPSLTCFIFVRLVARSHCTEPGPEQGPGPGTMGYYTLCRTVHTAQGQEQRQGPGNWQMGVPILPFFCTWNASRWCVLMVQVPVQCEQCFPAPVSVPDPCSVNVP